MKKSSKGSKTLPKGVSWDSIPNQPIIHENPYTIYDKINDGSKKVSGPFDGWYEGVKIKNAEERKRNKSKEFLMNYSFDRTGFYEVDNLPYNIDFEALQAIDLRNNGKLITLSDKTISDLIEIKVFDPLTNTMKKTRVNVAEASLSINQKLDALSGILTQNQIISTNERNTLKNLLRSILSQAVSSNITNLRRLQGIQDVGKESNKLLRVNAAIAINNNADAERRNRRIISSIEDVEEAVEDSSALTLESLELIRQGINKLKIPKGNHVAAGLPQRFYNSNEFSSNKGLLMMYILSQFGDNESLDIPVYDNREEFESGFSSREINVMDINTYLISNNSMSFDIDSMMIIPNTIVDEFKKLGLGDAPETPQSGDNLDVPESIFQDAAVGVLEEGEIPTSQQERDEIVSQQNLDEIVSDFISRSNNLRLDPIDIPSKKIILDQIDDVDVDIDILLKENISKESKKNLKELRKRIRKERTNVASWEPGNIRPRPSRNPTPSWDFANIQPGQSRTLKPAGSVSGSQRTSNAGSQRTTSSTAGPSNRRQEPGILVGNMIIRPPKPIFMPTPTRPVVPYELHRDPYDDLDDQSGSGMKGKNSKTENQKIKAITTNSVYGGYF
jgi:hypothetical protein